MLLAIQASTKIKECFRLDENSVQECFWLFRLAQKSRFASGLVKQIPGYFRPDQHKKQRNKDCKIEPEIFLARPAQESMIASSWLKFLARPAQEMRITIFLLQSHLKLQEYLRQGLDC
jgi:hypothetical protein